MIAVVALNRHQAQLHAEEEGFGQEGKDWIAVTQPRHARGYHFTLVRAVGQSYLMRDYQEIMAACQGALR